MSWRNMPSRGWRRPSRRTATGTCFTPTRTACPPTAGASGRISSRIGRRTCCYRGCTPAVPASTEPRLVRRLGGFRPRIRRRTRVRLGPPSDGRCGAGRPRSRPSVPSAGGARAGGRGGGASGIRSHLDRTGREGVVEPGPANGLHRVRFAIRGAPTVSIIVASACRPVLIRGERTYYLLKCLESIARSSWRNHEIIVLHGPRVPAELSRTTGGEGRRPGLLCDSVQLGAGDESGRGPGARRPPAVPQRRRGSHHAGLAGATAGVLAAAGIGAVGAKLLFPGGRLQHAGVAVLGGRPAHPSTPTAATTPAISTAFSSPATSAPSPAPALMTRAGRVPIRRRLRRGFSSELQRRGLLPSSDRQRPARRLHAPRPPLPS